MLFSPPLRHHACAASPLLLPLPCRARSQRALAIASQLAELGCDAETISAGLLSEAVDAGALGAPSTLVSSHTIASLCLSPLAATRALLTGSHPPHNSLSFAAGMDAVERALGPAVAALVHDAARVRALPGRGESHDDACAARLRTFCLAFHDVRAVVIELAARAESLRCAQGLPPAARQQLALETMQLYAPMAHALKAPELACSLEDLAFAFLLPGSYASVAAWLEERMPAGEAALSVAVAQLEVALAADEQLAALAGAGAASVRGRVKSRYSVMRKILRDGRPLSDVHDLLGLRVVVHCQPDSPAATDPAKAAAACYRCQEVTHALWPPLLGRSKDYVANPKKNGYASLHSAIRLPSGGASTIGQTLRQQQSAGNGSGAAAAAQASAPPGEGLICELQIRTAAMERHAEAGPAAHTAYKGGVTQPEAAAQLAALVEAAAAVAEERYARFSLPGGTLGGGAAASTSGGGESRDPVFRIFDKDGSGAITVDEIEGVARELGVPETEATSAAEQLLTMADADGAIPRFGARSGETRTCLPLCRFNTTTTRLTFSTPAPNTSPQGAAR